MTSDLVQGLVENKVFINGVVAVGCFLVIARFFAFVKTQWRDGLNPHLVPCSQCGKRLSEWACFCPGCGVLIQAIPTEESSSSLAKTPLRLGAGPSFRSSRPRRSRQR
ncbi:hypothetical protein Poly24_06310 [Rosistilla carotiformis]|uniref:Zinc-ribbon domain-containing protein n=1 Tax=Rosistilla carotiformis TaxID=2528017 RepID=A0A518JN25_9BACT|nr:hypothetical protein [Rosistilla carotiformis]QDV66942.1 hypothetical protein Poly24_06310 [Rosistilla carotiformis]